MGTLIVESEMRNGDCVLAVIHIHTDHLASVIHTHRDVMVKIL